MGGVSFKKSEAMRYIKQSLKEILTREGVQDRLKAFLSLRHGMSIGALVLEPLVEVEGEGFNLSLKVWELNEFGADTPLCHFPLMRGFEIAPWVGVDGYRLATQVAMEWQSFKHLSTEIRDRLGESVRRGSEVLVGGEIHEVLGSCELGAFLEERDVSWQEIEGVVI